MYRFGERGALTRAGATAGVERRLAMAERACPGVRPVVVPVQFLRMPMAVPGRRVMRGVRLARPTRRSAPASLLPAVTLLADTWRQAGYDVTDVTGLDGRLIIATDPAGYLHTLVRHEDAEPILTVASPPLPR